MQRKLESEVLRFEAANMMQCTAREKLELDLSNFDLRLSKVIIFMAYICLRSASSSLLFMQFCTPFSALTSSLVIVSSNSNIQVSHCVTV